MKPLLIFIDIYKKVKKSIEEDKSARFFNFLIRANFFFCSQRDRSQSDFSHGQGINIGFLWELVSQKLDKIFPLN